MPFFHYYLCNAENLKLVFVKPLSHFFFQLLIVGNQSTGFNRPFQMRAWSCITSYPLRGLSYLAYDNVNPAVVNSMMLHSSMHVLKRSIMKQWKSKYHEL